MSTRRLGDHDDVVRLYGRARELDVLNQLVVHTPDGGGAVVVRGEAGIGKSSLVAQAGRRAAALGMRTLDVRGVQSESHLPFAGLHQLLPAAVGAAGCLGVSSADRAGSGLRTERFGYKRAGITTIEIDSSHLVMLSHPKEVANLIRTAIEATAN